MRRIPDNSKIAVAMSGGVDSGVAASLLVERGYDVAGFFMHLWHEDRTEVGNASEVENKCCSWESLEAARKTAGRLGIPLYTVDFRSDFKKAIVGYFLSAYRAGVTPNPCVICNKLIKFGKLLAYVKTLGYDYLATGHYARLQQRDGGLHLLRAVDESKDQSYFLWQLSPNQLEHILFPIGGFSKCEVRRMARDRKLPVAVRPESFEICFIPDSLPDFLQRHLPEEIRPGPVLDTSGEVIGRHHGLPLYTYGQRRGFELEKYRGIPLYVVGIDKERNALIVGRGGESEVKDFTVRDVNWMIVAELEELLATQLQCRIRHQGALMPCVVNLKDANSAEVSLLAPARAVTPGQSAVFYRGEELLGGGIIELKS